MRRRIKPAAQKSSKAKSKQKLWKSSNQSQFDEPGVHAGMLSTDNANFISIDIVANMT
jgi:hypothetical protein